MDTADQKILVFGRNFSSRGRQACRPIFEQAPCPRAPDETLALDWVKGGMSLTASARRLHLIAFLPQPLMLAAPGDSATGRPVVPALECSAVA
jgi:hypothetical protein